MSKSTAPERIKTWVERQFNANHVERVTQDLIDVAAGNRSGNPFERNALTKIFPEWAPLTEGQNAVLMAVWSAGKAGYESAEMAVRVTLMKLALLGLVKKDGNRWFAK